MNEILKKSLGILLSLMIVIGLVSCGSNSKKEDTNSGEPKTLKVYTWWDITKFAHLQEMKEDFESKNPDIRFDFTTVSDDGYADTMITKLAGGEIPDVMMLTMDQVPCYAKKSMIMPLDDLANQEYKNFLYPIVRNALAVDGKMYAVGRDATSKVTYINTKMFKETGIEIPSDIWTMDEFVEIARQLTKGVGVDAQWGYYWKNFTGQTYAHIAAFGGNLYSEGGKSSVLAADENTKKTVQSMCDLTSTHKVVPTNAQTAQFGDNEHSAFMVNKVATQIGSLSVISTLDANKSEYTVLPTLSVNGVSKSSSFVNTWTIPKGAENPELSWRVTEFLSGKEGQQIALDVRFDLPASNRANTSKFVSENSFNKYFADALETAVPYPVNLNGAELQNMFVEECESLWAGAITPDEFAQRVDNQGKEILSRE